MMPLHRRVGPPGNPRIGGLAGGPAQRRRHLADADEKPGTCSERLTPSASPGMSSEWASAATTRRGRGQRHHRLGNDRANRVLAG